MRMTLDEFLRRHFDHFAEDGSAMYEWGDLYFCEDAMVGIYEMLVG